MKKKFNVFYFKNNVCFLDVEVISENRLTAIDLLVSNYGITNNGLTDYFEVIEIGEVDSEMPDGVVKNIGAYKYFKCLFKNFYENYLEV